MQEKRKHQLEGEQFGFTGQRLFLHWGYRRLSVLRKVNIIQTNKAKLVKIKFID